MANCFISFTTGAMAARRWREHAMDRNGGISGRAIAAMPSSGGNIVIISFLEDGALAAILASANAIGVAAYRASRPAVINHRSVLRDASTQMAGPPTRMALARLCRARGAASAHYRLTPRGEARDLGVLARIAQAMA